LCRCGHRQFWNVDDRVTETGSGDRHHRHAWRHDLADFGRDRSDDTIETGRDPGIAQLLAGLEQVRL